MTRTSSLPPVDPSLDSPLKPYLALVLGFYGALLAVVYPIPAAAVIAAVVVTVGISRYLGRRQGTRRTITVPGVGTIEYRFIRS